MRKEPIRVNPGGFVQAKNGTKFKVLRRLRAVQEDGRIGRSFELARCGTWPVVKNVVTSDEMRTLEPVIHVDRLTPVTNGEPSSASEHCAVCDVRRDAHERHRSWIHPFV